jgi:hypothetical protein
VRALLVGSLVATAVACYGEPDLLCDRVFVAWVFPDHEISSEHDVSPEPGIQIDVVVATSLPAGRPARLLVIGPDGVEAFHPEAVAVDDGGGIRFSAVDVPVGSVVFRLFTDDGCRPIETGNRRFVIDEAGPPACELAFDPAPSAVPALSPFQVLNGDDDGDPAPGLELAVEVFTRRAGMEVTLLVTDVASGATATELGASDESGAAGFNLSLEDGSHAVRALCTGGPSDGPLTTATFPLLVDTESPGCALIQPTGRVEAADDLDGDPDNGVQILMVGQTPSPDAIGAAAAFFANGILDGSTINSVGQSTAVVTVDIESGEPQDFAFTAFDLAGNRCTDSRVF